MNANVVEKLKKAGWTSGDAADFLGMDEAERVYLEAKLRLARKVEELRKKEGLSQSALALAMKTSQPNIARMEKKPESVSLDMLFKTLISLGLPAKKIASLL